jgi:hypothetical protein|tara:strand:+ start:194 stop:346 length:153 start_codon:yes stop_codon:yes gene_type:complete
MKEFEEIDKVIEKWETWMKKLKEDINDRTEKDKEQQNTKQESTRDSKDQD